MDFPLHENEILVWLLGTVVLGIILLYRKELRRLPARHWLFAAYVSVWTAWSATNLEHVLFYQFFNVLEHIGYALNGVLLLTWCWLALRNGNQTPHAYD
ncbi:MAG: hypothetical protein R3F47_07300 [Gammaproteobacteria bacterium]